MIFGQPSNAFEETDPKPTEPVMPQNPKIEELQGRASALRSMGLARTAERLEREAAKLLQKEEGLLEE